MAYVILMLYIFFVCLVIRYKALSRDIELTGICIGLFMFLAFRGPETGTDTSGYCFNYMYLGQTVSSIQDIFAMDTTEKGFRIYMWLLYQIAPFQQALLIAHGAIITFCFGKFMKRFSGDYLISSICFLTIGLGFHMTGMRQSIAMAICMIAYIYLADQHYIKVALLVLLAYTFHNSAMVFALVFLFGCIWKRGNNLISTGILSILVAGLMGQILPFLIQLSSDWENYSDIEATGNGFIFFVILIIMEFVFWLAENHMEDEGRLHVRVSYLAVIFWAGRLVNRTFERPSLFFFPAFEAEMPDAISRLSKNNQKLIRYGFIVFMSLLYVYRSIGRYYTFVLL